MPTELVMTTRMHPVRHSGKPGSGVRPIKDPAAPAEPEPFDRRPTAPIPSAAAKEAAELLEEAALLEAELAQTVLPSGGARRTPVPPPPAPITAVAHYAIEINGELPEPTSTPTARHAAARAQNETASGEFATTQADPAAMSGSRSPDERRSAPPRPPRHIVTNGPAPMHRADAGGGYAPSALRQAVDTRAYEEHPARQCAAPATPHHAAASGGYAPSALRQAVDTRAYEEHPARQSAAPATPHHAAASGGYAHAAPQYANASGYEPAPQHPAAARSQARAAQQHAAAGGGYAHAAAKRADASADYAPASQRHAASGGYAAAVLHYVDADPAAIRPADATRTPAALRPAAAMSSYAPAAIRRAGDARGHARAAAYDLDYAPDAPRESAADSGEIPTPARRASSTQWRAPNLTETEPDGRHASAAYDSTAVDEDLTQVRRQLAAALESARKHEQRAKEAELRASWAERYVPQLQDPELEQRAQRRQKRMRWLKRVLEISCVGLALGGYISLLVPVRERVIAQDAMIHQLTTLQQQLRDEKRALLQRIEELQGPSEATTPP